MYDTKGVMIYSQLITNGENKINLLNLSQGLYIVKQESELRNTYKKIVIE